MKVSNEQLAAVMNILFPNNVPFADMEFAIHLKDMLTTQKPLSFTHETPQIDLSDTPTTGEVTIRRVTEPRVGRPGKTKERSQEATAKVKEALEVSPSSPSDLSQKLHLNNYQVRKALDVLKAKQVAVKPSPSGGPPQRLYGLPKSLNGVHPEVRA